jgi:hypothetical protein
MRSLVLGTILLAGMVLEAIAAETEPLVVTFPSLTADGAKATMLTGELYLPAGPGPHAAVVILSGCYGVENLHRRWAVDLRRGTRCRHARSRWRLSLSWSPHPL